MTEKEVKIPEDVVRQPKYAGLKNLVLICEAMDEYASLRTQQLQEVNDTLHEHATNVESENAELKKENERLKAEILSHLSTIHELTSPITTGHFSPLPEPPMI